MPLYRNVSNADRYLVVNNAGVFCKQGDTVEVDEPGAVTGLIGQESVWEPVDDNGDDDLDLDDSLNPNPLGD
jgi:hypothetical protein